MKEFGDRPFVARTITGIRSFRVNAGLLGSPVQLGATWRPGENLAECLSPFAPGMPSRKPEHRAGGLTCNCGFYAYFDRHHNPYHSHNTILGLIEGYGLVTVGSRGFRCEKARIVALVLEAGRGVGVIGLGSNYPGVSMFGSVDEAVARFPLVAPEGTPPYEPPPGDYWNASWAQTANRLGAQMQQQMNAYAASFATVGDSLKKLAEAFRDLPPLPASLYEDPRERALQARRQRGRGPEDKRGIDGVRRRG